MARQLLEPILDNGVPNPFYFEGRLLTAAALREDQDAHRARQAQLGRALGRGVVHGLWVGLESAGAATEAPRLSVSAGLAINGMGQTLELPAREVVALARESKPRDAATGLFRTCEPPATQVEATGEGFYVLALAPASGFRGRAPASGLSEPKAGAGCGSRWAVEGVRLRLEPLDPLAVTGLPAATRQLLDDELLGATSEAGRSRLRNVVAHLCLGTEPLAGFAADPFARRPLPGGGTEAALARYGALDDLAAAGRLSDCDVPLALVLWRTGGVEFVDNWAVRRRLAPPPTAAPWPTLTGGRRRAEAEATLFQFQEQIAWLLQRAANPTAIRARDYFRWLPAAGLVPVAGGGRRGVDSVHFFDGLTARDALFTEGARIPALLAASLSHPPLLLPVREMLWRYLVRENREPATANPVLVFAGGHVPFAADAQFDLSRWNFSNFGPGIAG